MRRMWLQRFLLIAVLVAIGVGVAHAQTDVALSLYGAFHGTTNGNGTVQSPANSAGGTVELRHIRNPLIGYEVTYSYNRGNQTYHCSGITCSTIHPITVSANAHEITGDWVGLGSHCEPEAVRARRGGRALQSADQRPARHDQ
jgi:hypothetical protein